MCSIFYSSILFLSSLLRTNYSCYNTEIRHDQNVNVKLFKQFINIFSCFIHFNKFFILRTLILHLRVDPLHKIRFFESHEASCALIGVAFHTCLHKHNAKTKISLLPFFYNLCCFYKLIIKKVRQQVVWE